MTTRSRWRNRTEAPRGTSLLLEGASLHLAPWRGSSAEWGHYVLFLYCERPLWQCEGTIYGLFLTVGTTLLPFPCDGHSRVALYHIFNRNEP